MRGLTFMEYKVENLCGFLIRSKLMTANEMLAMRQRWQAEAKENSEIASIAKIFIKLRADLPRVANQEPN